MYLGRQPALVGVNFEHLVAGQVFTPGLGDFPSHLKTMFHKLCSELIHRKS